MVRRRHNALAVAFKRIEKQSKEGSNGKINWIPGHWRLVGSKDGTPDEYTEAWEPRKDELNRLMELVGGPSTRCPHPKWEDTCAKTEGKYWVLRKHCRKCEHYLSPKNRGVRYACCSIQERTIRSAELFQQILHDAASMTNVIMGIPADTEQPND